MSAVASDASAMITKLTAMAAANGVVGATPQDWACHAAMAIAIREHATPLERLAPDLGPSPTSPYSGQAIGTASALAIVLTARNRFTGSTTTEEFIREAALFYTVRGLPAADAVTRAEADAATLTTAGALP